MSEPTFNKVTGLKPWNVIEKRLQGLNLFLKEAPTQVFSCEICKIFQNYVNVGKPLQLNTLQCKPPLFLIFIYIFWSLKCIVNGLRHKHFPVKSCFRTIMSQSRGYPVNKLCNNYVIFCHFLGTNVTKKWPFYNVISVRNSNVPKCNVILT